MKKIVSILLVLVLAVSMLSFNAGAIITNVADVGKATGDVIPGVTSSNLNKIRKAVIDEFYRGIETRSVKHKGKAYFDYGSTTGELLHAWIGGKQTDPVMGDFYNRAMNQDFFGGYSDSLATLGQPENWCCILVPEDNIRNNDFRAFTVRDGIANSWGDSGATSSEWGLPVENQRWLQSDGSEYWATAGAGMYCIQDFKFGFAVSFNASAAFTEWFRHDEYGSVPSGGSLDYDWGVPESDLSHEVITKEPIVDEYPDLVYRADVQPDEEQGGEEANDQNQGDGNTTTTNDGEETPGETQSEGEVTAEGGETGSDVAATGTSSKKTGTTGTSTTVTTFLGMEVGSPAFIATICGAVALVAVIVVVIIVVAKKKKTPAEEAAAAEAPAEDKKDDK